MFWLLSLAWPAVTAVRRRAPDMPDISHNNPQLASAWSLLTPPGCAFYLPFSSVLCKRHEFVLNDAPLPTVEALLDLVSFYAQENDALREANLNCQKDPWLNSCVTF